MLAEVDGFVAQLHCLDALAHVVSIQSTRVEQGVAACHIAVPPVGQLIELGKVVLRRQERHSDREVVAARQEVLDSLSDILARGLGLEEEVAAVDVGAHVRVAHAGDLLAQLAHDDLVLASDVDAAQQSHVLHSDHPAFRRTTSPPRVSSVGRLRPDSRVTARQNPAHPKSRT